MRMMGRKCRYERSPGLARAGLVLLAALTMGFAPRARGSPEPVVDSTLRCLSDLRALPVHLPQLKPILESPVTAVVVRMHPGQGLGPVSLLDMVRRLGLRNVSTTDRVSANVTIFGAQAPWESIDDLAAWPGVSRVDSAWKPAVATALDRSVWDIHAIDAWDLLDDSGWRVTGRGVSIAVFDTGVDVFHPDLWRADGGTYPWLDVDQSGDLTPGVDGVDLDRNGLSGPGESLRLLQSSSAPGDDIPALVHFGLQPSLDWLYNDANGNGVRDYGSAMGYVEGQATFGERLFLARDDNQNGVLEVHEQLLALGTSKVAAVLDSTGAEYGRGVDLIQVPSDRSGHGTHVASVICSGEPGLRRFVGVAPDSRILVASFVDDQGNNMYPNYIPWALGRGADIMLYEFGSWVQEFLDGSSNLEQLMDQAAGDGVVQVAVAGNLAGMSKHAHTILGISQQRDVRCLVPYAEGVSDAWISILWQGAPGDLAAVLQAPNAASVTIPGNDGFVSLAGHSVWSGTDLSSRGTARLDLVIQKNGDPLLEGNWTLRLGNRRATFLNVNAYVSDLSHSWSGGVVFLDHLDDMYTVTSPGTSDSALTVGSHSTRARLEGQPGDLSPFSSQGPRLDGERALDLTSPGHYADVVCASSKDLDGATLGQYGWFGGTSAAAPHVAGAVALLLQAEPGLTPAEVAETLRLGARQDVYTGVVPNYRWGWGKLDVGASLSAPPKPTPTPRQRLFGPIILRDVAR